MNKNLQLVLLLTTLLLRCYSLLTAHMLASLTSKDRSRYVNFMWKQACVKSLFVQGLPLVGTCSILNHDQCPIGYRQLHVGVRAQGGGGGLGFRPIVNGFIICNGPKLSLGSSNNIYACRGRFIFALVVWQFVFELTFDEDDE